MFVVFSPHDRPLSLTESIHSILAPNVGIAKSYKYKGSLSRLAIEECES